LAVIVDDLALVHTTQALPENVGRSARAQAEQVLVALDRILKSANTSLDRACKLNVYLGSEEARPSVQQALAARFSSRNKPAVTFVVGNLRRADRLIAMDAIAAVTEESASQPRPENGIRPFAVLPKGPKIYVSGMADTNALPEAAKRTLEKLTAAIEHLGVRKKDIVQLKAFLQPMSDSELVRKEVVDFFDGDAPPVVFVEWISPKPNPPIEIELIARAKGDFAKEADAVSFLTPPGTTDTKVFRRVARINRGKQIYISGLYGHTSGNGGAQVSEIYDSLKGTLQQTGSDFEHLVKATYYVLDDESSNKLNEIRPKFYTPDRAPAASKAKVKGVGFADKTITLDMIAVPK
jgi:enamine deaminase RidA (YjgF/YER057c/UK114 family)